jgi:hypothetical protein
MNANTRIHRVLAILQYAYPDAKEIEVTIVDGYPNHLQCIVDGRVVPTPPVQCYA